MYGKTAEESWREAREQCEIWRQETEAKSRFKLGDRVRACLSPGLSLVGGIHPLPHDHNDPDQHLDTRVIGWDFLGRTNIACGYGNNPHCCEMCIFEKSLKRIRTGKDWFKKSQFRIGQQVVYDYELVGFTGFVIGRETPALLVAPHIKEGDWFVRYPRHDCGTWITRALNEKKMRPLEAA